MKDEVRCLSSVLFYKRKSVELIRTAVRLLTCVWEVLDLNLVSDTLSCFPQSVQVVCVLLPSKTT
jgi:hypothetical protein